MCTDKLKASAKTYFNSFGRLFGETPNFPSQADADSALKSIEDALISAYNEFGDDPSWIPHADIKVIDLMEELINSYK